MKLYSTAGSCGVSCHIALEWVGAGYDLVLMDQTEIYEEPFIKINPKSKVPALALPDGSILTEALAILVWIGDNWPAAELSGSDGLIRARVIEALSELTGEMHPAFAPLHVPQRFTVDPNGRDGVKAKAKERVRGHYDRWNDHMSDRDWIAGEGRGTRTVADAYLFAMCRWTAMIRARLAEWPALHAFDERMRFVDGVSAALKSEGID